MKSIQRYPKRDEEGGFTLIELLVVVLILGILMAIAIPTFLSLTGGARTVAAEADLTTAAQDEAIYQTQNTNFTDDPKANVAAMIQADHGINWSLGTVDQSTAGTKTVYIDLSTTDAEGNAVLILGTAGSDGNQYWIQDDNGSFLYAETSGDPAASDVTFDPAATSWKLVSVQDAS